MNTEELNLQLYNKMSAEFEKFKEELLNSSPQEVLDRAYEYIIKDDIVLSLEYSDLTASRADALLNQRTRLMKFMMLGWNLKAVTWMRSEKFWTRLLKVLSVMPSIKGKQKQRTVSDESCDLSHLKRSKGQEKLMLFRICKPIVRVSL